MLGIFADSFMTATRMPGLRDQRVTRGQRLDGQSRRTRRWIARKGK